MIQPLINAINWLLGFYMALPFAVQAFLGLVFVLFAVAAVIKIVAHSR